MTDRPGDAEEDPGVTPPPHSQATTFSLASAASPDGWSFSVLDASRPRRAFEHLTHSEVTSVAIGRLRGTDVSPESKWRMVRGIPIIVVDTLDSYWVFERVLNKLHGSSRTEAEAKGDLVNKLGSHLQLLSSLESSGMAPMLRLELEFLKAVLRPVRAPGPTSD